MKTKTCIPARFLALTLATALLFSGCSHISFKKQATKPDTAAEVQTETDPVTAETTLPIPETTAEPITVDPNAGGNPIPVQRIGSSSASWWKTTPARARSGA